MEKMNVNESFILQKVENVLKEVVGSVVDSSKAGWLDAIIDKALCDNLNVENLFSSRLLSSLSTLRLLLAVSGQGPLQGLWADTAALDTTRNRAASVSSGYNLVTFFMAFMKRSSREN